MPKLSKAPPAFYTASQAARRLGMNRGTFFYHVKTEKIRKYTPPGATEGYYSKEEIDAMAQAKELFLLQYSLAPKSFERASTEEDVRGIVDLCIAFYGVGNTPTLEARLEIWHKCPDAYYVIKQEDIVVGYISLLWFSDEALRIIMGPTPLKPVITEAGQGVYSVMGAENVTPFNPGEPIDSLFISLAVRPGMTNEQQRRYGFKLLRDTLEVLKDFARRGMPVRKLLATSEKRDGIKLAHDIGMKEIEYTGDKLLRFEMDLQTADNPIAREYQHYVKEIEKMWQQQFPELLELWIPKAEPTKPNEDLVFRKATLGDLEAEKYLAYLCFGPRANDTMPMRQAFLEYNPDMFYHLYDRTNLAAAINIVPLKAEAIDEFKKGKRGWLFDLSEIEQFSPGPHHFIIIDFMTAPIENAERRRLYATQLLMHLAFQLKEFGDQGVEILSIHASGGTEAGRRILHSAGFKELGEPVPGRVIFELDVQSSSLKLLQPYKKAFAEWRREHVTG
ncbi:MAG: hypothetical protein H0V70_24155 [Ktedonobacteraceae bacterium]|nr:hypothetical protein [Ktedonobacteraceae bacterium]